MEAVKANGGALEYASEELRNDREVVLSAIRSKLYLYDRDPYGVSDRTDIIKYGWVLEYGSEELRNDSNFVLEAVKADGMALEYPS